MICYVVAGKGEKCTVKFDSDDGHYTTCGEGFTCSSTTNLCEILPTIPSISVKNFQKIFLTILKEYLKTEKQENKIPKLPKVPNYQDVI
jgi:hypothetical protein